MGCRETGNIREDPEGGGYPGPLARGRSRGPQCAERTGRRVSGGRVAIPPPCTLPVGDGGVQREHARAARGESESVQHTGSALHIVAEILVGAGTLADGSSRSWPDARDGRDREVECGRPPTGGRSFQTGKNKRSSRVSGSRPFGNPSRSIMITGRTIQILRLSRGTGFH